MTHGDADREQAKARFKEALERKKRGTATSNEGNRKNSKIAGTQSQGSSPRMFRRKSGSA